MQQEPILTQSQGTPNPQPPTGPPKKSGWDRWKGTLSTMAVFIIAPLIAFLLTAFVFQSYEVDGPSMEPTLQNQDRLIVWKLPRTISRITGNDYMPARGDIVIFIKHGIEEFDPSQDKQLIKRVVALPGERVVVRGTEVTVYNSEHPEGFNPDTQNDYKHIVGNASANIDLVVPEHEIFVMGDNRPNSLDSRAFGAVPVKDVVGTLAYRIFPINKAESF